MFPFLEWYPTVMKLILLLIIIFITAKYKIIISQFKRINKKTWIILTIIFIIATIIRVFLIPHTHYVYSDEFNHVNVAQNILYRNEFCHCPQGNNTHCQECILGETWPPGQPTIGAISMKIFGDSEETLFNTTAILGSLSVILIFLISYLIYQSATIGLIAGFILTLLPVHIKYSGSFAQAVPAVFFILLSMFFLEIFIKKKDVIIFCAFLASTLYATQTRTELIFLPLIFFIRIITTIKIKKILKPKYIISTIIFLIFLTIPLQLIYYETFINEARGWKEPTNTKLTHVKNNIIPLTSFYLNSYFHPIILTILFFIGLKNLFTVDKKKLTYFGSFYLLFFIIYLAYEIANYTIFKDTTRYFLITYVPFILISVSSFQQFLKLKKRLFILTIILILIISIFPSISFLNDPSTGNGDNYLNYKILYQFKEIIPNDKYLITTFPTKTIATIQKNSITPQLFYDLIKNNQQPHEVYLYNSPNFDNFEYFYYLENYYNFELIYYEEELDKGCSEFCLYSLYKLTLKEKQSFLN